MLVELLTWNLSLYLLVFRRLAQSAPLLCVHPKSQRFVLGRGLFCGKYVVVLAFDDVLEIWFWYLGDDRIRGCERNDSLLDFLLKLIGELGKWGCGKHNLERWLSATFPWLLLLQLRLLFSIVLENQDKCKMITQRIWNKEKSKRN